MKNGIIAVIGIVILTIFMIYRVPSNEIEGLPEQEQTKVVVETPKVGYHAPRFSLSSLYGQTYSLESLEGKPVLINFWASWCEPCKTEAPELVKLYETYKDKIEIYAINVTASDTFEGAKSFAEEYGFSFPVLMDEQAETAKKFAIQPIPTTFFVNREGVIVDIVVGPLNKELLENKMKLLFK
ncbi:thiol:disulfide interchange protein [Paenibacillus sp. FSL A5-0031]|uniref:TlpA disulfide reductase family protein n=1 Tax=Paenibacillus sp. FSL A5-0031 TaxID=1920420 RepID=UPI00096EC7FE|nr:TlpA disulfide reductase family protein [Paenibacillus sp. FSL A5-0031]OME78732.1 thiol:disulfide interchange protein [Paenibacillus sp. FSL A5-0031]